MGYSATLRTYLHAGRGGVAADQHADLLLVGEQRADRLLVRGVAHVHAVHLQDAVAHPQTALTRQALGDHLLPGRRRAARGRCLINIQEGEER